MSSSPIVTINSWDKKAKSSRARLGLGLVVACVGCGGAPVDPPAAPPGSSTLAVDPPVDYAFRSLDERPVSDSAMRGKATILAFVTTDSLLAQAQVDFLVPMAKHDADKVNYAVVLLAKDHELAELYVKSLDLRFPAAVLAPDSPVPPGFGDLNVIPLTVLLDPSGRVVWRAQGRVARPEEIRRALRWIGP
jgi:hypothetical protein